MLRLASSGKAESFCVDGDIKRVAGNTAEAALAYLNGHIADHQYTETHLATLEVDDKNKITDALEQWLKTDEASRAARKKMGVKAVPDEIWSFIFSLQPQAMTTCFARIEPLLKDHRYQQVIDSCSAILHHYPNDTAPILLQRGLAYTLLGNHEKEAISDYLRAFIKDKDATLQVTRSKHGQHLPKITETLMNCIYSETPNGSPESKQRKKWLQLTTDCCKFLLTLDPDNFRLQMTYAERLTTWSKLEKAIAILNESIGVLQLDLEPVPRKLAECWLRLGYCCLLKHQNDAAVAHFTLGLNAASDHACKTIKQIPVEGSPDASTAKPRHLEYDVTRMLLEDNHEIQFTAKLARDILSGGSGDFGETYSLMDKAASRFNMSEKVGGVMKLDCIRQASDIYRAISVFKPKHRDTLVKLALCYAKLGRQNFAIKIYDFLLSKKDYAQDNSILSARAACYREIGKKVEARKDYDILLRDSPKDAALLFERALVHMENKDIGALVTDLQTACKSNQRTVSIYMNKLPLAQRTRIRQILFEHAKSLLHETKMPESGGKNNIEENTESAAGSVALAISQLLTKLYSSDHAAHIIKAHALFFVGNYKDSEVSLKRLLDDNPKNPDKHMIILHLGVLRVFTRRMDDGMASLVEVLHSKGERIVFNLLRDLPMCERSRLSDEAHKYAIDILQKRRDQDVVQQAAHCLTIAILCCRGTEFILQGVNGGTHVCRSYLARAECMAHLGDQHAAVYDFSAALEVNPGCVEGLCGRAFMRLALGEEQECVEDIISACELDTFTVTAHINALPDDAKKLLLFWLDHRVVSLLLNYGHKDRIGTGGSSSTISITDETVFKPGYSHSRTSSLSSIQPPSVNKFNHKRDFVQSERKPSISSVDSAEGKTSADPRLRSEKLSADACETSQSNASATPTNLKLVEAVEASAHLNPVPDDEEVAGSNANSTSIQSRRKFHKSSASTRNFGSNFAPVEKDGDTPAEGENVSADFNPVETPLTHDGSRGSTAATQSTSFTYDDVITGMEKAELLHKAQLIGTLLVAIEPANSAWHGMYADIFIVKGDFDDALRHLHIVMQLTPGDVTAIARAGLINVKQNCYRPATSLLSSLVEVDKSGLLYVLKALDTARRKRLSEEAFGVAEALASKEKYNKAVEYYGLSLCASSDRRAEKLRLRAKCFTKLRDAKRAAEDITMVIRETSKPARSGDYCTRAHIFLLDNREKDACHDYKKALKIDKDEACVQIHSKPGRGPLARVFYRQALEEFGRHNYQECVDLCDNGVVIDSGNVDIRKLRARARKEIGNCAIQ